MKWILTHKDHPSICIEQVGVDEFISTRDGYQVPVKHNMQEAMDTYQELVDKGYSIVQKEGE